MACSTSCVKLATRFMAARFGRASPYWWLRSSWVRGLQAIMRAIIRSKPLKIQEINAIGCQNRPEDLSFLSTLGSIATCTSFQASGKKLSVRKRLYSYYRIYLTKPQHILSRQTMILSIPGEVLETLKVLRSTSIDIDWDYGRPPIPTQFFRGSELRSSSVLGLPRTAVRKASTFSIIPSIITLLTNGGTTSN